MGKIWSNVTFYGLNMREIANTLTDWGMCVTEYTVGAVTENSNLVNIANMHGQLDLSSIRTYGYRPITITLGLIMGTDSRSGRSIMTKSDWLKLKSKISNALNQKKIYFTFSDEDNFFIWHGQAIVESYEYALQFGKITISIPYAYPYKFPTIWPNNSAYSDVYPSGYLGPYYQIISGETTATVLARQSETTTLTATLSNASSYACAIQDPWSYMVSAEISGLEDVADNVWMYIELSVTNDKGFKSDEIIVTVPPAGITQASGSRICYLALCDFLVASGDTITATLKATLETMFPTEYPSATVKYKQAFVRGSL